ncbi:DUF2523 family protein [Vibrio harveyi]|uniref:DUF2523 family protein n=1 Tax=Vibrio harveyi TaxID=669 RepID=UPI00234CA049|nr:DUF2523 family protein [Vibrio harveyi]WCP83981.1 DUF2523 family protein [Vibrio harveyi]WCP83990.1 DUF2523 family protein [Vibrio harveyi]
MDYIYAALEFIANVGQTILDFIGNIPDWILNCVEYGGLWVISIWLDIKIASIQISLKIAQALLSDYGVYTLVESNFNSLPSDVRYILTQYGFASGLRIIFDAFSASLVMRFFGW